MNTETEEQNISMPNIQDEQAEPVEQVEQIAQPASTSSRSTTEDNIGRLREEKARLKEENSLILNRLKQYEAEKAKSQEASQGQLGVDIGDDELFEGRHYKDLVKQNKSLEDRIMAQEKLNQQTQAAATEARLNSKYKDFNSVMTNDNIEALKLREPELAATVMSNQDSYTKLISAYKLIKKLGIYVDDGYGDDREAVKKNSLKPRPIVSIGAQQGDSPLTKANSFASGRHTEEMRKQAWKDMNEAVKNR